MLRFSPPGKQRLAQAAALDIWVAGSESNVAVALSVLGVSASWVSRLPDHAMGRKVESALLSSKVDVSNVVWTSPTERIGTFYAEHGSEPRAGSVIYDRAKSAASYLSPADLADELFLTHKHLHVSGITPALSESCAEAIAFAIGRAKEHGMSISLDVNYRAKLWSAENAAAALSPLIKQVDVLFCSRDDAARLFGVVGDDLNRASSLREKFDISVAAVTCSGDGAVACDAHRGGSVPAIPIEASVERFGSGDAFAAGFLAEYLAGSDIITSLRLGVATAALKRTVLGDLLIATRADVEAVLAKESNSSWR